MKSPAFARRRRVVRSAAESLEARDLFASVSAITPYNGQQSVAVAANVEITFGSAMNASTLTSATVTLYDPSGNVLGASLSYNATTRKLTLDPSANLDATKKSYYRVRVLSGTAGVKGTDGSTIAKDVSFGFSASKPVVEQPSVITGLSSPMNVEFAADGHVFVAEKSGIIKGYDSLSDHTATIVADLRTNVHNYWDRGLLGMAVDPKFAAGRPYLYVLYTADMNADGVAPKWGTANTSDDSGGPSSTGNGVAVTGRLSRLTIGSDGVAIAGSERVLIHDWFNQFPSHSIGDLKFGPDGYLYASAGDGASFNAVDTGNLGDAANRTNDPTNEGGAIRAQDVLSDTDPAGLDGTIIRINADTGAAAPGNPYASSVDPNKQKIIANGLRNPFRITFKPGTNELWVAETGWNTWEEINVIPNASGGTAMNFGWPAYEGVGAQSGYKAANVPLLQSLYNNPSLVTSPWFTYAHSAAVVAGSGEPTGGSSPTGIAFYNGSTASAVFKGALFFADYSRKRLYVMHVGLDGKVDPASVQVAATGTFVEITEGPNGDLYAVDMVAGMVDRLVMSGVNRAPTASLVPNKTSGAAALNVTFDAAASADPDGDSVTLDWDLDGDGVFTRFDARQQSYTYSLPGTYAAKLRVTDALGLSTTTTQTITVSGTVNAAPVPTITSPLTSLKWSVGQSISFSGGASDAEDGTLAASRLNWDLILVHGSLDSATSAHEHKLTSFAGVAGGSFIAPDHEYPSWIVLRLTATDSAGVKGTSEVRIDPRTVVLTFNSNVSGTTIVFNDAALTAPYSRTVIAGSLNSLSAPANQTTDAGNLVFQSWSQGGAASQTFSAPSSDIVYTATYVTSSAAPAAPTAPAALIAGPQSVEFSWTDASGNETGFVVQRRYRNYIWEDVVTVGANVSKYVDNGVYANVAYEYRVAAKNASGISAWTDATEADTGTFSSAPPTAPSRFASPVQTNSRIDLAWTDNATTEAGYKLERRLAGGAWGALVTLGADVTTYSDATVAAATAYEYRLTAFNNVGTSAVTLAVSSRSADGSAPANPSGLAATLIASRQVRLTWTDNSSNESGFIIQRRYAGWIWGDLVTVGAGVTSFVDTSPFANCTYEYRIVAMNSVGNSGASNGVEIKVD